MGATKLMTAAGGGITLDAASTASDKTLTIPAHTGTILTNKTAGTVLQVVEGVSASETFTNSTSYVATNLTASITPTSATSKILVIVSSAIYANNAACACAATIYRDGSDIASSYSKGVLFFGDGATGWAKCATTILDSPASSSALTYVLRIKTTNATYSTGANINNARNTILLMEIAA